MRYATANLTSNGTMLENLQHLDDFLDLCHSFLVGSAPGHFRPTATQEKAIKRVDKAVGCRLQIEHLVDNGMTPNPPTILSFVRKPVYSSDQDGGIAMDFQVEEIINVKRVLKKAVPSMVPTEPSKPPVTMLDEFQELLKRSLGFTYFTTKATPGPAATECTIGWLLEELTDRVRTALKDSLPPRPSAAATTASPQEEEPDSGADAEAEQPTVDPIDQWEQSCPKHPTPWKEIRFFIKSEATSKTPGDRAIDPVKHVRPFLRSYQPHPEWLWMEMEGDLALDDRINTPDTPRRSIWDLLKMHHWAMVSLDVKWRKIPGTEIWPYLSALSEGYKKLDPEKILYCRLQCRQPMKRKRAVKEESEDALDTPAVTTPLPTQPQAQAQAPVQAKGKKPTKNQTVTAKTDSSEDQQHVETRLPIVRRKKATVSGNGKKKQRTQRDSSQEEEEEEESDSESSSDEEPNVTPKRQRTLRARDAGRHLLRDDPASGSSETDSHSASESEGAKRRRAVRERNRARKTKNINPLGLQQQTPRYYMCPYTGSTLVQ